MGGSFKIGRFSGIDVRVHWTFFLLLAFFAFLGYQTSGTLAGALTPTAVIVALFLCVLLHEVRPLPGGPASWPRDSQHHASAHWRGLQSGVPPREAFR